MRSLLPVSLVAGVASIFLCFPSANGAAFHRNSLSSLTSSWLGRTDLAQFTGGLPRGGADATVEETKEAEAEVLYLPGLLDVELKKSTQVRGPITDFVWDTLTVQQKFRYCHSKDNMFSSFLLLLDSQQPNLMRQFLSPLQRRKNLDYRREMSWLLWVDADGLPTGESTLSRAKA